MSTEDFKTQRATIDKEINEINRRIWELRRAMSKYKQDAKLDEYMNRDIERMRTQLTSLQRRHTELGGKKYA